MVIWKEILLNTIHDHMLTWSEFQNELEFENYDFVADMKYIRNL